MIYLAALLTLGLTLYLLMFQGNEVIQSGQKVHLATLFAILFTTGLDGGLLLLPLLDFKHHLIASQYPEYLFAHPIAIEFGFWGGWSWAVYFVTACYFALFEPKLKLFKRPLLRWLNSIVIILTCAFSAWLLIGTLKLYLPPLSESWYRPLTYTIVVLAVAMATFSSSRLHYIKNLSLLSSVMFLALIAVVFIDSGSTISTFTNNTIYASEYLQNIDKFVFPINAYHEFYQFWWMAWSVMIGQFVAKFVAGLRVYQLFLLVLILPSAPILIWFVVLYQSHASGSALATGTNLSIAVLGVLFVVNSMDSLIRVYSYNLNLTRTKLGIGKYFVLHFALLTTLVVIYDFKMLNINLVGSIVTGLWLLATANTVYRLRRSSL